MASKQATGPGTLDAHAGAQPGDQRWGDDHPQDAGSSPNFQGRVASPLQGSAHPLAVYDGRRAIGLIRSLTTGFEALDLERRSLGIFPTRSEAADAIEGAASS
jgi:hypothetical protein